MEKIKLALSNLEEAFRRLVWATLGLYLIIIVLGFLGFQANRSRGTEGERAHTAICALREDKIDQLKEGRKFLKKHPKGIDGISARDIEISLKDKKDTIKALKSAKC